MIEHISHNTCPDCGSAITSETKRDKHVNGHWNEERKFNCGAVFSFSPNFMRVDQTKLCSNTKAEKQIKAARVLAKENIKKYIALLDVDDAFKELLLERFNYVNLD